MIIPVRVFAQMVCEVGKFASADVKLPVFGCVQLVLDAGGFRVGATDRYTIGRLTRRREWEGDDLGESWSVLVPRESWKRILRVFSPRSEWDRWLDMVTIIPVDGPQLSLETRLSTGQDFGLRVPLYEDTTFRYPDLGTLIHQQDEDAGLTEVYIKPAFLKRLPNRMFGLSVAMAPGGPETGRVVRVCELPYDAGGNPDLAFDGAIMSLRRDS